MTVSILTGDCRAMMATLPEASVDAIVCDPPYELGFMGKGWDSTGIANDVEVWRQALRVLKPGGHLLSFSGTRTYHRMVCAIEDAGFEIRDQIGWLYGSGFPKSKNLDGSWQGWGTALKPAWEPIVVARKPLIGTVAANVLAHGTGALNIDGCRVGDEVRVTAPTSLAPCSGNRLGDPTVTERRERMADRTYVGRWPANIIHDGSDEVLAAFPESTDGVAVQRNGGGQKIGGSGIYAGSAGLTRGDAGYGGSGSAARFFYCAKADASDRGEGLQTVSQRGRNHHPTVKPTGLMRYLCRLVTPPGGTVLDPFMGSGSTLKAAELEGFSAIGIELDPAYVEIARRRIAADAPLFAEVSA
jgi:hypothetical protein